MAGKLKLLDEAFKQTIMNMLKALTGEVDNMQKMKEID